MRLILACFAVVLWPVMASAHVGHWAPAAGHDHILIGLGIGVIIIGALTALGKRKGAEPEPIEIDDEDVEQEA